MRSEIRLYLDHAATTPVVPAARRDGGRAGELGQPFVTAWRWPRGAGCARGRTRSYEGGAGLGWRGNFHQRRERGDRAGVARFRFGRQRG